MSEMEKKISLGEERSSAYRWAEQIEEILAEYRLYLVSQEKSDNTIEKYIRDVKRLLMYTGRERPQREMVLAYKSSLK